MDNDRRDTSPVHRNSAFAYELVFQASQLHAGANTQTFEVATSVWEKTSGCSHQWLPQRGDICEPHGPEQL